MLVHLAIAATCNFACAEDLANSEAKKRVEYLIELLASKNAAPEIQGNAEEGDDPTVRFGEKYSKTAQVAVYLAAQQLLAEDEFVIGMLIEHFADKRYSYSVNAYHDDNLTVGEACSNIVERKIYSFESELIRITRSGPHARYDSVGKWWNENKERGLGALQLECIEEWIAFFENVDAKTALPIHPDAQPTPLKEFEAGRAHNLHTLKAIRDSITQSGKPYLAKSLDTRTEYFFGLPWTGRKFNK